MFVGHRVFVIPNTEARDIPHFRKVNTAEQKYLVKLGKRIRTLREAKGIDQKQFAFECGISRTQLYTIEKGETNPRATTLIRIAKGLDISIAELLDF